MKLTSYTDTECPKRDKVPKDWEQLFSRYDTKDLLKLQKKISKELLRRLQQEEDR